MHTVLLLNGSPHERGCTDAALREVAGALEAENVQTQIRWIGARPVAGCIACGSCARTNLCCFDDQVNEILCHADMFDGLIVGSPVYYAGPTGQICAFLDRLFHASGGRLQGKPGAAVVSCRRGGGSAAFDRLNKYFTIANMPVVPSQYWNQVHGCSPQDVQKDLEGLQTMRTLGQNMAWMLRCFEAGKQNGASLPAYEPILRTNFIP